MSDVPHTLPCPFCAESIQTRATHCRYCQADVRARLVLTQEIPSSLLSQATRELFERFGTNRFASYGQLRKLMNQPKATLMTQVDLGEAQQAQEVVERYEGRLSVERFKEGVNDSERRT